MTTLTFRAWYSGLCHGSQHPHVQICITHIEMYHEVTNMSIQRACGKPYSGNYAPRSSLVGSVIVVLGRATDQDWDMDQELRGWGPRDDSAVLRSGTMQRVSLSSSSSLEWKRPMSKIKRRSARSKWQGKARRQSKERWHEAQSSQKVWKSASSDAKWTEVTEEMDHLNMVIHEKQPTWNKSLK